MFCRIMRNIGLLVISATISACGSGGFSNSASSVGGISLRDKSIIPGARTTIRVQLDPGAEYTGTDSDGDATYTSTAFAVTVRLPKEVTFVDQSSRLSEDLLGDVLFGNPDPKEPIERGECPDGVKYLRYFFERGELGDPEQLTLALAYLKLDIIVPQAAAGTSVGAAIAWQHNACDEPSDRQIELTVGR